MNSNVKLALCFTFLGSASRTVWSFSVLTNYLYYITTDPADRTLHVGISEGVQGGVQAVVAVAAGIAADRFYRTDRVMKMGGALGIFAGAASLFALLAPWPWANAGNVRYWMITASVGLWGAYQGIYNTTLETIYADSIRTGQRSKYNTWKFVIMQASTICGPLLALILFINWGGDQWHIDVLRKVFIVGVSMSMLPALLLFFFDDDKTLGKASEAHTTPKAAKKKKAKLEKLMRNAAASAPREESSALDVSVEFDDCTWERESHLASRRMR